MREKRLLWVFILFGFSAFSQIKGIVVDENDMPIPYVNIWVENENIGTTSEEDGSFNIDTNDKNKNLFFSIIGFEKKTVKANQASKVVLQPITNELDEVVIFNKKETKEIQIGIVENTIFQAFDNGPKNDIKFFPYNPKYNKTKYIKQVKIATDSKIEAATLKLHFFAVDENGFPGSELLKKDLIVTIKNGGKSTKIDVSDFNLIMPKKGIFVGFEKLMIENNKLERTSIDRNTNLTVTQKLYYPFVLYNYVQNPIGFTFISGKWIRNDDNKTARYEPAISLILTN
jgi:hypothetical protein